MRNMDVVTGAAKDRRSRVERLRLQNPVSLFSTSSKLRLSPLPTTLAFLFLVTCANQEPSGVNLLLRRIGIPMCPDQGEGRPNLSND